LRYKFQLKKWKGIPMRKHLWLATVTVLAIGVAPLAKAADLSYPALTPFAAPGYNWTGIYLGLNGGYGWGDQDPLTSLRTDLTTLL
jgi:opacity protein-like surface antigen